jgi:hypothetical protein
MTLTSQSGIVWYNPGFGFHGLPVRDTHGGGHCKDYFN